MHTNIHTQALPHLVATLKLTNTEITTASLTVKSHKEEPNKKLKI